MSFFHIACVVVFVALTVPGFVLAVRALPRVEAWVVAGIKPWACDICMCFWSTGLWVLGYAWLEEDARILLACGPAYSLALLLLAYMQRPPPGSGPPPEPPETTGLAEELEG